MLSVVASMGEAPAADPATIGALRDGAALAASLGLALAGFLWRYASIRAVPGGTCRGVPSETRIIVAKLPDARK